MKRIEKAEGALHYLEAAGQFLMLYGIYQLLYCGVEGNDFNQPFRGLWLAAAVLLFALLRIYARQFILFFAGHFLAAGTSFFLAATLLGEYPVLVLVFLAAAAGISVWQRYKLDISNSSWIMLAYAVLLVAAAAFAYVKEMGTVWKINYVCGFLQILLMLVFHNKCEANRFVKMNRDTANLPAGQMIRVNRMMMGIYTILGLAVMGIFSFLPFNRLFSAIGQGLLSAIRFLVKLIFREGSGEAVSEEMIGEAASPPVMEPSDPSAFLEALSKLIGVIVAIALVIGAAAAVLYLFSRLYRAFYEKQQTDGDQKEFIGPPEQAEKEGRKKREARLPFFSGNRSQKMRRIYQRLILERTGGKKPIPETSTAEEQSRLAEIDGEEKRRELVELYRKARYGRELCREEDLFRMRELRKALKHSRQS